MNSWKQVVQNKQMKGASDMVDIWSAARPRYQLLEQKEE